MNYGNMPWFLGNSTMVMERWWGSGFLFLVAWSLLWGGLGLWHAARREDKGWFIVFLLLHTAGILELIYLVFVVKIFSKRSPSFRKRS